MHGSQMQRGVIDDLGPLNRAVLWLFEHESCEAPEERILARANYITQRRKEKRWQVRRKCSFLPVANGERLTSGLRG